MNPVEQAMIETLTSQGFAMESVIFLEPNSGYFRTGLRWIRQDNRKRMYDYSRNFPAFHIEWFSEWTLV
jgi:hypothetical protein